MTLLRVDLSQCRSGKNACLNEECGSSDAMHYYSESNSAYCFSCQHSFLDINGSYEYNKGERMESPMKNITDEESKRIKAFPTSSNNWRGIRDEIYAKFGFRHEYKDGELHAQYVPVTFKDKLCGYKTRILPKDFSKQHGEIGVRCQFINQYAFRNHTGTLLIVGGETKSLAAYQMLLDNNKRNGGKWDEVAVVSPTVGEGSVAKQIKNNYEFVSQFHKVIICMDSDEAGEKAANEALKACPQNKTYVMKMRLKDADEYIKQKRENDFIRDYLNSKLHISSDITVGSETYEDMLDYVSSDRYSLPPQDWKLQEMLRGGLPTAGIVNLAAGSGIGKSSIVNGLTLHMLLVNRVKMTILPFENSTGEYMTDLVSTVINRKIAYIETKEERIDLVKQEDTRKAHKLINVDKETGENRLFILDVDLDIEEMKRRIIEMIVSMDVKVFVLDPVSDLQDIIGMEEMGKFMAWLKQTFKRYKVLFILINHIRKSASGQASASTGGDFSEESITGSSTIFKSGAVNILLRRNKESDDPVERNTTYRKCTKARGVGITGQAGALFYNVQTHRFMDLDDYLNGEFEKYDNYYNTYYNYKDIVLID